MKNVASAIIFVGSLAVGAFLFTQNFKEVAYDVAGIGLLAAFLLLEV